MVGVDVVALWCWRRVWRYKNLEPDARAARHRRWLRKGGKAVVKSGSLAGRVGTVQWVTAKRVGLEARLFGAARVITVERDNVESAA